MTYDIYRYIFIGGAVLSGIMLLVTVFLFVYFNIPKVISDLSGATARKAIDNIRRQNEESGEKIYKPSAVNEARGRVTDKITPSGRIVHKHPGVQGMQTAKIETQQLNGAGETSVLEETATETAVLCGTETTVLDTNVGETSVLEADAGQTTVLSEACATGQTGKLSSTDKIDPSFCIEYEITYIHTNELIAGV